MSATNYLEGLLLNYIAGISGLTVALYTSSPTDDSPGVELSADSYQRKPVTFGAASGGSITNNVEVLFDQATTDWGLVSFFGLFDSSGNLLVYGNLSPVTINYGDSLRLKTGTITVSMD